MTFAAFGPPSRARPTVTASNGALGVRGGQREPAAPTPRAGAAAPTREYVTARSTSPQTPGTVPLSVRPSPQHDLHVDRRRLRRPAEHRLGRAGDPLDDRAHARRSPGRPSRPGGSVPRAISAATRAVDVGARRAAPRAAAGRRPTCSSAVELDRQRVLDLVVPLADADAEPLAQERAHRALDERDEVVELEQRRVVGGGSGPARNGARRGARARQRARRRRASRGRSSTAAPACSAPAMKFRGSNGCSGWRVTTCSRAGAPSAVRTVRSTTSSSSPTGTAGGATVFVRSSLPV